jgi:hypothetical protein
MRYAKHTIAVVDSQDRPSSGAPVSKVDTLPSAALVSYQQAASYLGVSPAKVNWLMGRKHLQGTRYGVTVGSVRKEKQWRATASTVRKTGRVIGDALSLILAVLFAFLGS